MDHMVNQIKYYPRGNFMNRLEVDVFTEPTRAPVTITHSWIEIF